MIKLNVFKMTTFVFVLHCCTIVSYSQNKQVDSLFLKNILRVQNNFYQLSKKYTYNYSEKAIITADADKIENKVDTIKYLGKIIKHKLDSSRVKFKKLIEKQHLYVIEKEAQVKYAHFTPKEEITKIKMAGLKQPIYELIGQDYVPHRFNTKKLKFFTYSIPNPLHYDTFSNFDFEICDWPENENWVQMHFYFNNNTEKKRITGYYLIDKRNFAVVLSQFYIDGIIHIDCKTTFEWEKDFKWYITRKQEVKLLKGVNQYNIDFLGETIRFNSYEKEDNGKYDYTQDLYFTLNRDYFNYVNTQDFKIAKYHLVVDESKVDKNSEITISNTEFKEFKTYQTLDSLVSAERFERKIYFGKKLINGYIPISFFDVNVRQIVKYNNYEGFRFGIGGQTNDRMSNYFKIFGYAAYGAKDDVFKNQIGIAIKLSKKQQTWISYSFTDDITEFAEMSFLADHKKFKLYDPRPFNISTFYRHQTYAFNFETRWIPQTETYLNFSRQKINPLFEYNYNFNKQNLHEYQLLIGTLNLEWSPNSKFLKTSHQIVEVEKNYPKINFQFSQSIPNFFENNYDFTKIDVRFLWEKKHLSGHKTLALFQSGIAFGETPLSHLYSTSPNNLDKESLISRITFAGKYSFETMIFNEFFSDKYSFIIMKHFFNKWKLAKSIKPTLVVGNKIAFGDMSYPERHQGIQFKTMDKGFFEAGFELQNIFKGFGLSTYYRYGAYQFDNFEDNLAIKISFVLNIGI